MLLNSSGILERDKNKLTGIHNILQIFFAQAIELWATEEKVCRNHSRLMLKWSYEVIRSI